MNFGPQTASNCIFIFTHRPKSLYFSSLPGFAHVLQTTELSQTLPHGRGKRLKTGPEFLPTLRKFGILLHCQALQTELQQTELKLLNQILPNGAQ